MKIKYFLPLLLLCGLPFGVCAQSVVITPKKTTYTRRRPLADYKKTFTVNRPVVKAANAALSQKIEAAISYEKNLGVNIREEMGEIQWLEEADYEVKYNRNGVLCLDLFVTGSGAYPDSSHKTVVVDLKTGNQVKPADVFTNLGGLIAKIKQIQKAEIGKGIEEINKDPDSGGDAEELFKDSDFRAENLEGFSLDEKGVTFHYDYGFPHVIQALEPEGDYFLAWAEIKPFIKPAGLLGRFIR